MFMRGMPLQLFKSYLRNRTHYTVLNGANSKLFNIKFDIPQSF